MSTRAVKRTIKKKALNNGWDMIVWKMDHYYLSIITSSIHEDTVPYIGCTLNLAAQILQKLFLKKPKEIQGGVFRNLLHLQFIKHKLNVNIATDHTSKSHPKLEHSITSFVPTLTYDYLFLVFVDSNFFVQHSFNFP